MTRVTSNSPPFYCSPETGCRSRDCEGQPVDSGKNHGIGSDEWHFVVTCDHEAMVLSVFGTQLHEKIPGNHPARRLSAPGREPRGMVLAGCRHARPDDDEEGVRGKCEWLGVACAPTGASYMDGDSLWRGIGVGNPDTVQPEPFWAALELLLLVRCWSCESTAGDRDASSAFFVPRFV